MHAKFFKLGMGAAAPAAGAAPGRDQGGPGWRRCRREPRRALPPLTPPPAPPPPPAVHSRPTPRPPRPTPAPAVVVQDSLSLQKSGPCGGDPDPPGSQQLTGAGGQLKPARQPLTGGHCCCCQAKTCRAKTCKALSALSSNEGGTCSGAAEAAAGRPPADSGATGGSDAASSDGARPAMLDRLERRGMRLPLEPGAGSGTGLPRPPSHGAAPDAISSSPACALPRIVFLSSSSSPFPSSFTSRVQAAGRG